MVNFYSFHMIWSGHFCIGHWRVLFLLGFFTHRMTLKVTWWPWISIISDRNVTCKHILQVFSLWSVIWDDIFLVMSSIRNLSFIRWSVCAKFCLNFIFKPWSYNSSMKLFTQILLTYVIALCDISKIGWGSPDTCWYHAITSCTPFCESGL